MCADDGDNRGAERRILGRGGRRNVVLIPLMVVAGCGGRPPTIVEPGRGTRLEVPPVTPAEVAAATRAATDFGCELLRQLVDDRPGENVMISPTSVHLALSVAAAGARGETADELVEALSIDGAADDSLERNLLGGGELVRRLVDRAGSYELSISNLLWLQGGMKLRPEFVGLIHAALGPALVEVDFQSDAEDARNAINQRVADDTHDRIEDLLPPGSIDVDTRLVITNGVYFRAAWLDEFEAAITLDAPFTRATGDQVSAPMMHKTDFYPYHETPDLQVLSIPYEKYAAVMLVILPRASLGLDGVIHLLNSDGVTALHDQLAERRVGVYLPRFRFRGGYSLLPALRRLGLDQALDPERADFSGIVAAPSLGIQAVEHRTFVDVTEKGTEAAAATGVALLAASAEKTPIFRADRPFVFAIRHRETGALLFLGIVNDPTAE